MIKRYTNQYSNLGNLKDKPTVISKAVCGIGAILYYAGLILGKPPHFSRGKNPPDDRHVGTHPIWYSDGAEAARRVIVLFWPLLYCTQ